MRSDSRPAAALLVLGLAALLLSTRPASAEATLTMQNADTAGEGFNDATPATPVGGNAGTTLGERDARVPVRGGGLGEDPRQQRRDRDRGALQTP